MLNHMRKSEHNSKTSFDYHSNIGRDESKVGIVTNGSKTAASSKHVLVKFGHTQKGYNDQVKVFSLIF